jgi:septum formation protein
VRQLWKLDQPLLLASTSATRLNLLKSASIPVEPMAPNVNERLVEADLHDRRLTPDLIALELARAKGSQVSQILRDRLVISADQTLALGTDQFHKPGSREGARAQLLRLSGQIHSLHSAVTCFRGGECIFSDVQSAHLKMRDFGAEFVDAYLDVAGASVTQSVGGYQLEGPGVHLFESVEGDHSTILGLPILPVLAFLRTIGAVEE